MGKLETADQNIDMVLNLFIGPAGWQSDPGRMKNVLPNSQLWQDNVILGDVTDNLLVSKDS